MPSHTEFYSNGFGTHIKAAYNKEIDCCTIPLPSTTLDDSTFVSTTDMLQPKVLAVINSLCMSNTKGLILHPDHPATEPNLFQNTEIFGKRFGVPFQTELGVWLARPIASIELLHCYGITNELLVNPNL